MELERLVAGRGLRFFVVLGALVGLAVQSVYQLRYSLGPIDDAYIHLHVARNFAEGDGPVFNVGDRVEVTSSPLWTLLLGGLLVLPVDAVHAMLGLSLAVSALTCGATAALGYVVGGPLPALVAPLLLAVLPSFAAWTGSGMETPLAILGLAMASCSALASRDRRGVVRTGLLAGVLVWIRPDAMALLPSLLGAASWNVPARERRAAAIAGAAAWVLPVVVLFVSRRLYFGEWLPNTYYAKVANGGLEQRLRGLSYTSTFFVQHPFLCLVAAYAVSRRRVPVLLLSVIALNLFLAIVWAGGDGFTYSRLTLPALALVCAMAASVVAEASLPRLRALGATVALTALQAGWTLKFAGEFSRYTVGVAYAENATHIAELIGTMPKGTVATEGIGAIGFLTRRPILDLVGLADKHIARSRRIPGARIGHDHADVDYVLRRAPEIVLPLVWMQDAPLTDETELAKLEAYRESWASALSLVKDPRFRQSYRPRNYVQRDKHLRVWLRNDVADGPVVATAD